MAPLTSIIIPHTGDPAPLAALLDRIGDWEQDPLEIIVVGARVSAEIESLCRNRARLLRCGQACRGTQLAIGARQARGCQLWFVHAGTEPHPDSLDAIDETLGAGATAGYFRFRFNGARRWYKKTLETFIALRARVGIPYGDQGLFMTRDEYHACGGFAEQPLFEEVRLIRSLRRRGRCQSVPLPIGVSSRRWESDGWIRRTLHNRLLALAFGLGVSAHRLSAHYRGESAS